MTSRARSTAWRLRASPASDRPAPRPTASWGERPSRAQATAAVVVVLPMPISPAARRVSPSSASSRAREKPTARARSAASRGMAGPFAMFRVPPASTTQGRTPGGVSRRTIPRSTGNTCAPAVRAMWHTEERRSPMVWATVQVTS